MSKDFPISWFSLLRRHMNGIRRVVSVVDKEAVPPAEFAKRCREFQQTASTHTDSLPMVADSIWNAEGMAVAFGKRNLPDGSLQDPNIPRETLGIVHVGYGIVCAEYARFDAGKLRQLVETKCVPNYRGFTYEGIGSALLLYEPGLFKLINRALGIIPPNPTSGPSKEGFFAKFFSAFPPDAQRKLTHGYGRLTAFSRMNVHKAIRASAQLPQERVQPYVQGLAVAFGMLNIQDIAKVLEHSDVVSPAPLRAYFQNGLIWVLAYCDWFAPGVLAAWKPQGKLEEFLVAKARQESASNAKRGYPGVGILENPITA